jgi:hypothetical protein
MYNFDVFTKVILDCWIAIIGSTVFFWQTKYPLEFIALMYLFYTINFNVCFALKCERRQFPKSYQC